MRRHLAILLVLSGVATASLAWQIEGPAEASTRPLLVCPLGAHGLEPAPFPRAASGG